jgi:glycosyltransferase involved in cell wall biosynthesis
VNYSALVQRYQEREFDAQLGRWAAGLAALGRGRLYLRRGLVYRGLRDLCWAARVSSVGMARTAEGCVLDVMKQLRADRWSLVESYHRDPASAACARIFSLEGGSADLFRDLIVLKRASAQEKGVILLKYARTFSAVHALLDMRALHERYTFVLEPCWAGYCDPSLLMFLAPGNPVFVQCFTREDYELVTRIGEPLVPLRLGPADWVDADLFSPPPAVEKTHDVVMVANWARHKRHVQLFRALKGISDRRIRVLLIGFPWGGRTAEDIRREAAAEAGAHVSIDVVERLTAREVADRVSRCKVFVFLSRKEGDNKALVESMFLDVPVIVFDKTIGGASSRVNPSTGILASDEELADKISEMLDRYQEFAPREWACSHSGSSVATRVLDEAIRRVVTGAGGRYTEGLVEKANSPNLAYKDPACRARFQGDYDFILQCRRTHRDAAAAAVA